MRGLKRAGTLAAVFAAACSTASAHYAWTYFAGRNAPYRPVTAKFDLNTLQGKTVYYFVSDQAPGPLVPGDSFQAIMSQIRLAGDTWDGVAGSDLRVKFGGLETVGSSQATPGIDVVFDDEMPPGLLAQTRVFRPEDVSSFTGGGSGVPILRSRVQLRRDLTAKQQASYSDKFFATLVHEFGHALGLQHTMTSGAMSTAVTRATTKARPLAADDIAGISALYPTTDFTVATGSISGQVFLNGGGANLASVVAISTSGVAVSGMSHPDGTYRIEGVPPGAYYVYAHSLPPPIVEQGETTPANIIAPVDTQNVAFPANTGFAAQFFPGTRDVSQAFAMNLTGGQSITGINFNVQPIGGPVLANVQTWGSQVAGTALTLPSPALPGGRRNYLAFYADAALVNGNQLAPGLTVRALGNAAVEPASIQFFAPNFVLMIVNMPAVAAPAPVALAISTNNDLYVLPAAFTVVPTDAPSIASVTGTSDASGGATVVVTGTNLTGETRVMFDGAAGQITEWRQDGALVVAAPPASGTHRAAVVALNADGQTSMQALGSAAPPAFTYSAPEGPVIGVSPNNVVAGTDSMIEVFGFNTNFVEGHVAVGFGTSDILVRRVWVVDRNRLMLNVTVHPLAAVGSVPITVVSGLQVITLRTILQVQPFNQRGVSLRAPVVSDETGMAGISAGRRAIISTQNLPGVTTGWTLTIGGLPVNFLVGGGSQINVLVPAGLQPGPTPVKLTPSSGEYIAPIVMQVNSAPPVILGVASNGTALDASHAARAGDTVMVTVAGLTEPNGAAPAASAVRVKVGGVDHVAQGIVDLGGSHGVTFVLSPNVPFGPQQPLSVGVGTRYSVNGFAIAVVN